MCNILSAILNDVIWSTKVIQNHAIPSDYLKKVCLLQVSIDSSGNCVWTSAGTLMSQFMSRIYTGPTLEELTHWDRVTHMFVSKLTITGPYKGFPPGRCQAIIWTRAGIMLIGPLGTIRWNLTQNWYIFIQGNAFKNVDRKLAVIWPRPHCVYICICIFT